MKYIKEFWKNKFNTEGRISKKDFFITWLLMFLINSVVIFIPIVGIIYLFITIPAMYIMAIRRLHDINKSGWYIILMFIPFVFIIFSIYLFCANSVNENNKYANPPEWISLNINGKKVIIYICILAFLVTIVIVSTHLIFEKLNDKGIENLKQQISEKVINTI